MAMLHLAQVQKNSTSGETNLVLLAAQKNKDVWEIKNSESLPYDQRNLTEGMLVLVSLGENYQILEIKDAKNWVVGLVQQYLTVGSITPEFIEAERARLEQWRRELTSQSQDVTRLRLEVETRREQLQELEASLKLEREKLKWQSQNEG
ncbi:MAG: hypothetical protein ACFB4I_16850 [Cyanophyceae cyanobacterium]